VNVAFVTMTWARTEPEARLLLASLTVLSGYGASVFVTDGGSPPDFVSCIRSLPHVALGEDRGGLVSQVSHSLRRAAASDAELLVYTEPDKQDFFRTGIEALITEARTHPDAALTIASRDECSMATFPAGQRRIEQLFNQLAGDLLGWAGDLLYGPFVMTRRTANEYLPLLRSDLGWGWRTYLTTRCVREAKRVIHHSGHFPYSSAPSTEDDEQDLLYRLEQFMQNVRGLRDGLRDTSRAQR
jgi:hypothetical protein